MNNVSKEQCLDILGYTESPNYCLTGDQHHPLTAHLFRAAQEAGAEGAYLFHTSPDDEILPPRPAVYIAKADTPEEAREIHRSLWNLGNVPFLITILPNQIRVYTGFAYDRREESEGRIRVLDDFNTIDLKDALADYSADSIDSGRLWASQARHLKPDNRVDTHLLRNLRKLENILVESELNLSTAHALIGKYVYIRYLWDRKILSPQWLAENDIDIDSVLGRGATLRGLRSLVTALDERFNGHIFPLPLSGEKAPTDQQVTLVASAFKGDDPASGQMPLFDLYDFSYIPVETLSAIYEQFLHSQGKGKKIGAVYTPEHLADYLLSELNHTKPLERGMKVLDPCCGSGIFLVLAYRKLIEMELSKSPDHKLRLTELRRILTESIFGVERSAEACYVTELSLILTMLHYISPPELHRNPRFKFPVLHNSQIFEADFFEDSSAFWQKGRRFDWIIGNPPWIRPKKNDKEEYNVLLWISNSENGQKRPVADNRVVEAFSWRVTDLLTQEGHVGLVLDATSLFNYKSQKYRQAFFKKHEVIRITNFSNLSYVMFNRRSEEPAATVIYRGALRGQDKTPITHYGPFLVNQLTSRSMKGEGKQETWIITINEDEIKTVSPYEAERGEALTWKLALWGNYRDKKSLQRLHRLFPTSFEELIFDKGWSLHEGLSLRTANKHAEDDIEHVPELIGREYFDAMSMSHSGYRFSIPEQAFKKIPENFCYIRKRGGRASVQKSGLVHLLISTSYCIFSDRDFIYISRRKRLSAPRHDADELRAISIFLGSSIAQYHLFFSSSSWGIGRSMLGAEDIRGTPIPVLTPQQISELARLQKKLVLREKDSPNIDKELREKFQELLDSEIERILDIPKNLSVLAKDFIRIRLSLNKGKIAGVASQAPQESHLLEYGELLRDELDNFAKGRVRHQVAFLYTPGQEMVTCEVTVKNAPRPLDVSVSSANGRLNASLSKLNHKLRQQFSQWVYVQRGLRIFDGSSVYICKAPRLIDWTKTQALNDADDLIAEVLSNSNSGQEVAVNGTG